MQVVPPGGQIWLNLQSIRTLKLLNILGPLCNVHLAMFAIRYYHKIRSILLLLVLVKDIMLSLVQVQMAAEIITTTLHHGLSFDFS